MPVKGPHYFATGIVISTYVVYRLINLIMSAGNEPVEDFRSLLTFDNIVFCVHIWVLFLSGWILVGRHNRNLLLIWTIGHVINLAIYYQLMAQFLTHERNIYALIFVSPVSLIVLYLVVVERRKILGYVSRLFAHVWFRRPNLTKFEVYLMEFIRTLIMFEILFALLISAYGLVYHLGPDDSFYETMQKHHHPDLFNWYFNVVAIFTIYLTILLLKQVVTDRRTPDDRKCQLTVDEKLQLIKRMNKRF